MAPQADVDERWMAAALEEASAAGEAGDVPVGAILVSPAGEVVARGQNRRERDLDPTAHAEIVALRAAARERRAWRLGDLTLYVTLEPCPMCAGALINARIARLVYGCSDPKAGAIDTLLELGRDVRFNHRFEVTGGVAAVRCGEVLRSFFSARRSRG